MGGGVASECFETHGDGAYVAPPPFSIYKLKVYLWF